MSKIIRNTRPKPGTITCVTCGTPIAEEQYPETGRECTVCHEREGSGFETPGCTFEEVTV